MRKWDWKRKPGHEAQPLLEWYAEQVAILILRRVGFRARDRKDQVTWDRMFAIAKAGSHMETKPNRQWFYRTPGDGLYPPVDTPLIWDRDSYNG